MRCQVKLAFKTARQREAVGSRLTCQIRQPDVFVHMRVEVIACTMRDGSALPLRREPLTPVAVGGDLREQIIHRALLNDFHLRVMQCGKGLTDATYQPWLARQRLIKVQ